MNSPEPSPAELSREIQALIGQCRSLQLATISESSMPEASYTPYIYEAPWFYILVSGLATHTENLLKQRRCGVMVIEDEDKARNLFARTRLMLSIDPVEEITNDGEKHRLFDLMEAQLGNTISMLRTLPDFRLLRLSIREGRFVKGFGAAYGFSQPDFSDARLLQGR